MKGHNIRHCFQALLKYRIMGSPQDQTVKLRICLKEIIVLTGFQFPDLLDCGDQCLFQIIDLIFTDIFCRLLTPAVFLHEWFQEGSHPAA